jgi:hypothetical protein
MASSVHVLYTSSLLHFFNVLVMIVKETKTALSTFLVNLQLFYIDTSMFSKRRDYR